MKTGQLSLRDTLRRLGSGANDVTFESPFAKMAKLVRELPAIPVDWEHIHAVKTAELANRPLTVTRPEPVTFEEGDNSASLHYKKLAYETRELDAQQQAVCLEKAANILKAAKGLTLMSALIRGSR